MKSAKVLTLSGLLFSTATLLTAQTADELISKNIQIRGGIEQIKAIKSYKLSGKFQQGSFTALISEEAKAPDELRQMITIQGMTQIQAYDGAIGWQISPFQGRRDPERLGEDDLREISEDADFYGPLVDYKEKSSTAEYLGHDMVDGDDAFRLKITLKNGDIYYSYLDPDTYMEIRAERQQFIRGSVKETQTDFGSYKQVDGVYYPFSIATGPKNRPEDKITITIERMEGNVNIPDSAFKMPIAPRTPEK